ncbi:hypothetical protein [Corynebacterium mastitidis]|uniref:hypothetical protein n=2 Tax=Corynebacterium mastitidis TaxID=161890 RepID=UPI00036C2306|nr:hypothetical protein [Corynebacterium mastitidis]
MNTLVKSGLAAFVLSGVSLLCALLAMGEEYRRLEARGIMPGPTSEWILYWAYISLAVGFIGVIVLVTGILRRR